MGYKIKRIYQGSNQVRPAYLYKYEYDFRNKTTSQVSSDGWEATRGSIMVNSNGLYSSGSMNELFLSLPALNTALANAKKITYHFLGRHGNSGTADNFYGSTAGKYPNVTTYCGCYNSYGSSNQLHKGGTTYNFTQTATVGVMEFTYVVDLVAKTAVITFQQGSTNSFSSNLSDTNVTNIKTCNYIRCMVNGSNEAISKIDITVE